MENEGNLEWLEKMSEILAAAMGGEAAMGGPLKAMYLEMKANELSRKIEGNEKFMSLPDDSEIVQSLIKLRETEIEVLKKILKNM